MVRSIDKPDSVYVNVRPTGHSSNTSVADRHLPPYQMPLSLPVILCAAMAAVPSNGNRLKRAQFCSSPRLSTCAISDP